MHITRMRVRNYKGFDESDWFDLANRFTVIVGKNNAGKTALVESFRLSRLPAKPHRSLARGAATPLNPASTIEFDLNLSGRELLDALLRHENQAHIPLPPDKVEKGGERFIQDLFGRDNIQLRLAARNNDMTAREYPSLGFKPDPSLRMSVAVNASPDRLTANYAGEHRNEGDTIPDLIKNSFERYIYVFRAERLNIGRSGAKEASILEPNGANLAAVLASLQGNPIKFDRFKQKVFDVFPNIKEIAVVLTGTDCEVRIWSTETDRDDLGIALQESGTGIGQVLAILYVAETVTNGIVVIDEPSTFLHPGAAKKLVEILADYDTNQYVLATHSAELIAAIRPEKILLVSWSEGKSRIESLDGENLSDIHRVLSEVGVTFSDVFGYDTAIWVEGQTEEICFPLLLRGFHPRATRGAKFIAVLSTGDFERRGPSKGRILEIYNKLSKTTPLLPARVVFSFDREDKKDAELAEIVRESRGRISFLPRRSFENYLLDPHAISVVINQALSEDVTNECAVADWITRRAADYLGKLNWSGDIAQNEFLIAVDAPRLLDRLFSELTEARLEYRKTTHSLQIMQWLLANKKEALTELAEYVYSLRAKLDN